MTKPAVIAVDGTAASGKGTLARMLARHYGFAHLDTGALYRLVALGVLDAGGDPGREADAVAAARRVDPARADDPRIRTDEIAQAASRVSVFPGVRAALLAYQRSFAADPPGGAPGVVIDGRDIGTVVCPGADAKIFVDARPEVRAARRSRELAEKGRPKDPDAVHAELLARDRRDAARSHSPLKPAPDADLLDTSDLGIDAAFAAALALVEPRVRKALAARHRG